MNQSSLVSELAAEFLGTFVLVFGGCGSAVFAASVVNELNINMGIGFLTCIFLFVILGATDSRAPVGFAPLAIGLSLTLIHLISIPISNTSVNPARSLGVAVFGGGEALGQVWAFFVAPLLGAAIAGFTYKYLFPNTSEVVNEREEPTAPLTR